LACDNPSDCTAYMSDAADAKVVVYSLNRNTAWYVTHSSMLANPDAVNISLEGQTYVFRTPVNGIALSPADQGFDRLIYCPLASFNLYSVPVSAIKAIRDLDVYGAALDDKDVTNHGTKPSQSGGIVNNAEGGLLFGLLGDNAIGYWNTSNWNLTESEVDVVVQDNLDMMWPDAIAIDEFGYAYVTANKLHRFQQNSYDFNDINFRVVRFFIGFKSYLFPSSDPLLNAVY